LKDAEKAYTKRADSLGGITKNLDLTNLSLVERKNTNENTLQNGLSHYE
jgi:hypothetical protein